MSTAELSLANFIVSYFKLSYYWQRVHKINNNYNNQSKNNNKINKKYGQATTYIIRDKFQSPYPQP